MRTRDFASPGQFAEFLQRLAGGLPAAEATAIDAAAEVIEVGARAALEPSVGARATLGQPRRGTATRARTLGSDDIQRSIRGRSAAVGVPEGPAAEEAIDLEFGTPDNAPEAFLGAAAFQHGEAAAAVVRDIVGAYIAGLGLVKPPKK